VQVEVQQIEWVRYFHGRLRKPALRFAPARDDKELYSDFFQYTGKSRKFSEWCADNAQALNDELELCYSVLAEDIIAVTAADNIQIFKNS
jgi:hypothetical protein